MNDANPLSVTSMLDETSSSGAAEHLNPGLLGAIDAWREKRRADIHQKVAARSAAASRKKYREACEAKGKSVRQYTYHGHLPQQPGESLEDYRKRIHRDRQRTYKATAGKPRNRRADLSKMTPEERAEHTRKLATARKRRQRAQEQSDPDSVPTETPSASGSIEWGMF